MLINDTTKQLAIDKGYKKCTCSMGGYPSCICSMSLATPIRQDELAKWLRDVHKLHTFVDNTTVNNIPKHERFGLLNWYSCIDRLDNQEAAILKVWNANGSYVFNSYEEAVEGALVNVLKLI